MPTRRIAAHLGAIRAGDACARASRVRVAARSMRSRSAVRTVLGQQVSVAAARTHRRAARAPLGDAIAHALLRSSPGCFWGAAFSSARRRTTSRRSVSRRGALTLSRRSARGRRAASSRWTGGRSGPGIVEHRRDAGVGPSTAHYPGDARPRLARPSRRGISSCARRWAASPGGRRAPPPNAGDPGAPTAPRISGRRRRQP